MPRRRGYGCVRRRFDPHRFRMAGAIRTAGGTRQERKRRYLLKRCLAATPSRRRSTGAGRIHGGGGTEFRANCIDGPGDAPAGAGHCVIDADSLVSDHDRVRRGLRLPEESRPRCAVGTIVLSGAAGDARRILQESAGRAWPRSGPTGTGQRSRSAGKEGPETGEAETGEAMDAESGTGKDAGTRSTRSTRSMMRSNGSGRITARIEGSRPWRHATQIRPGNAAADDGALVGAVRAVLAYADRRDRAALRQDNGRNTERKRLQDDGQTTENGSAVSGNESGIGKG